MLGWLHDRVVIEGQLLVLIRPRAMKPDVFRLRPEPVHQALFDCQLFANPFEGTFGDDVHDQPATRFQHGVNSSQQRTPIRRRQRTVIVVDQRHEIESRRQLVVQVVSDPKFKLRISSRDLGFCMRNRNRGEVHAGYVCASPGEA